MELAPLTATSANASANEPRQHKPTAAITDEQKLLHFATFV